MPEVGVRELKARLSEYLRRVQAGELVTITDRGKRIAVLRTVEEDATPPAWLVQLAAEGQARLPQWGKPVGMTPRVRLRGGASVSRAILEDRR